MSRRICSCGSLRIASRFPLPSCRFVTASICCRSLPHATPSSFLPFTTVFPMSSWKRLPSAFHWWRRTPAEWPRFLSRGSTPSSSKRETSTIAVAQSRMSRPAMAKPFGLLVQKLRRWCWSISRPSAKRSATSICSMESLHEEIDLHRPRADTRLLPRQAADAVVECRTAARAQFRYGGCSFDHVDIRRWQVRRRDLAGGKRRDRCIQRQRLAAIAARSCPREWKTQVRRQRWQGRCGGQAIGRGLQGSHRRRQVALEDQEERRQGQDQRQRRESQSVRTEVQRRQDQGLRPGRSYAG